MWYPSRERTDQLDARLAKLESASGDLDKDPEAFLVRISAYIRHLAVTRAVPSSYLRDWIWIGSQYRINLGSGSQVHVLARRALAYLEESLNARADRKSGFTEDFNWVTDSTVSDLRAQMGPNDYDSFLSSTELQKVGDRLRELRADTSSLSLEEELALETYVTHFSDVRSETYLPGIAEMISRLQEAIQSNGDDRAAAVACLRYVLQQDDTVHDTLSYLGLVDDIHAIEWTYREIENRATWAPLLERFNFEWPYVARVGFDEGDETVRCSPYMQSVFGKALHGLRKEGGRTCLVLPETGISGLVGAFLACVESIRCQAAGNGADHRELVSGEDIVLGDANALVRARYAGTYEYEGKSYHRLELKKTGKVTVSKDILWFARRAPKPHKYLSSNEEFNEWKKTYCPSSLTHLVGQQFRLDDLRPQVLLITRRYRLDDLVPQIRPMGSTVPELAGIKYVTATGTEANLAGTSMAEPLIWSCSDVMTARELLVSGGSALDPRYVIVDDTDLAAELEDLLVPGELAERASRVVFSDLHETESIRRLLDKKYETWLLKQSDVDLVPGSMPRTSRRKKGAVSRYQQRQAIQSRVTTEIHEIDCEPIELLYEHVRELRRKNRQVDDLQLEVIAIAAGSFIRRFTGTPLEFDELEREELQGRLKNLILHCGTLADYHSEVRGLADDARTLLQSGLPTNPREAKVESLLAESSKESIAVLCQSAHAAATMSHRASSHPVLSLARWVSMQQLRQDAPFSLLIVPGWFSRLHMRELRNSGYALHMAFVFYRFEKEMETRSKKAGQSWERRLASRMGSQWGSLEREFGHIPRPSAAVVRPDVSPSDESVEDEPDTELLDGRIIESIRSRTAASRAGKLLAKARLVTFEEPGTYIYLPPHGSVISLSRALEAIPESLKQDDSEAAGREAERLISCPVGEIQRGDLLAFPVDRTADLLDNLADRFIPRPEETRRLAALWRTALQEYIERTGSDPRDLQIKLERAGLKRHPLTIRMWVTGSHVIAPMSYPEALTVIGEVTGHEELRVQIEDVKSAIDLVYRGRGRAAQELVRQLARREIKFHDGLASVAIEGQQVNYHLHRVLTIDPPVDVAQEEVGVLGSITDFPSTTALFDPPEA